VLDGVLMASRSLTSQIQRNAIAFSERLAQWELQVFDLEGASDSVTKANINRWLDDMEQTWDTGMVQANASTGFGSAKIVRSVVNQDISKSVFRELYANEILRLSRVDFTKAIVLRNALALEYGKNYKQFYDEYNTFIGRSLGKSLHTIQEEFMTQSIYIDNVFFVDSSGRMWRPDRYSEMWARTRQSEIDSEITMDDMNEVGLDIVQISNANTVTPICLQYEGKYFSKTGKTPGLPILPYPTPFHPNCRHDMIPISNESKTSNLILSNKKVGRKNASTLKRVSTDSTKKTVKQQTKWLGDNREVK